MKNLIVALALLSSSLALSNASADMGEVVQERMNDVTSGVQYNVPSTLALSKLEGVTGYGSCAVGGCTIDIEKKVGCAGITQSVAGYGAVTTTGISFPVSFTFKGGDCFWVNASGLVGTPITNVWWTNVTKEEFEGRNHANLTRLEMNTTRTEQNDIQNTTRTEQNDIQNATRTEQNHLQNTTRTEQNDIQNDTLETKGRAVASRSEMNATSLNTFETQTHVNATYCKLNESSQLCRGNFLGDFAGNYSGVGIPNTTALNQTADHLLQMESSDLDNPNSGELFDEKGPTWFYDGLTTGPSFRDNTGTIDFTSGYAQTSECALTGHVESFSIGGWIPDPDLPANGRLFNTSAGAGSSGNIDEFIITYLENTNLLRFNLGAVSGTFLFYNSHGSGPFHVFLTFDNSTKLVKTYRNGTLVEQHSTAGSEDDGIYFGNTGQCWFSTPETNAGNRYQGTLAQWRIYEGKALTTTEISALASGTWGEPGLIDYIARMPDTYRGGNFTGTFDIDTLVGDFSGTFTGNVTGNFTGNATLDELGVLGNVTLVTAADEWIPLGIWGGLLVLMLYYVAWLPAIACILNLAANLPSEPFYGTAASVMLFVVTLALHVMVTRSIIPAPWGRKGSQNSDERR